MKRLRFLDLVREVIRLNHLSYSTEKSYVDWIPFNLSILPQIIKWTGEKVLERKDS